MIGTEKTCTQCGETKLVSQFFADNRLKSGVRSRCKTCLAKYCRAWERANPEKKLAVRRRGYVRNRDTINAKRRAAYALDPEKVRERARARREASRAAKQVG